MGMLRSVGSKVAWVGRTASMVFGLALVLALIVGVVSAAFGADGDNFILGQNNAATTVTRLAGAAGVDGPMLQLINNNAGTNDTALTLNVQAGEAPMRVNRDTLVTNLNADKLDGQDSVAFLGVNGKAVDSDKLDDLDQSAFMRSKAYQVSVPTTGSGGGNQVSDAILFCDEGDQILSGGIAEIDNGTRLISSIPGVNFSRMGWYGKWANNSTADSITITVLCADFPPLRAV